MTHPMLWGVGEVEWMARGEAEPWVEEGDVVEVFPCSDAAFAEGKEGARRIVIVDGRIVTHAEADALGVECPARAYCAPTTKEG